MTSKLFKLVDLRSISEVRKFGKINGSINIPSETFLDLTLKRAIKCKNILLYCQSGKRSARSAFIANKYGYNCINLGGLKSSNKSK